MTHQITITENQRPSWHEYFMEMAFHVAKRSTCLRRKVGAIIVKNKRILTTGYNGPPVNLPHCNEIGCIREKLNIPSGQKHELCRGIHAEQNSIIQAAIHGISINNSIIYCTHHPCSICTKMLINSNISKIYYKHGYPDSFAQEMLKDTRIEVIKMD